MSMNIIERKVLGALLALSNDSGEVRASNKDICSRMGYNIHGGGAISSAIRILEMLNFITIIKPPSKGNVKDGYGIYKVLV